MQINYQDYIDAGFRVFGLHPIVGGQCQCDREDCEAAGKHPIASSWQHTPHWSEEQIEVMEETGQFDTGFGVLVDGHVIIDIDPRNGGDDSYTKLCSDLGLDFKALSGFVVATGGGGHHIYFNRPSDLSLQGHLAAYPGIDFKNSGFVVGAGSLHASGMEYEVEKGSPDEICDAPSELLSALEKQAHRAVLDGSYVDVSDDDISGMLACIDPDCDYETWVKVGMAVHHATSGAGYDIWDDWSKNGKKYTGGTEPKWHSFGKSANPVTLGTLVHHAKEGGYVEPVTFESDLPAPVEEAEINLEGIDLRRPPGFVGKVAEYINDQCRYPRENIAAMAAITTVGNIAGLRHDDELYGTTGNLISLCIAASSTGKEAVQQAALSVMRAAGVAAATHGGIKSEQELVRNMVDHQAAFYIIDEFGIVLKKIRNATLRGGASYLEGVIGMVMSMYSKANSFLPVQGDVRKEIKRDLRTAIASARKVQEDSDSTRQERDLAEELEQNLVKQLESIDSGLERPFMSILGFTTPVTFDGLVDYEMAVNGFISRALLVHEKDTNPRSKPNFSPYDVPSSMAMTVSQLYRNGHAETVNSRIEQLGDRVQVATNDAAQEMLIEVQEAFHDMAENAKELSLEAIPRRGFELVLKISFILGIPEGVRTVEHVSWAYKLVKRDIEEKINLAAGNIAEENKQLGEALQRRLIAMLDYDHGEKQGTLVNRCRPHKKEEVILALENMKTNGWVDSQEIKPARGRASVVWVRRK